ncbi:metal ABC transporter substrate-binding protein [Lacrimispora sp.]|uniref:metal ABC transporter substrate-binding protein n=1 Tax=Lacrimispora sp. TaxID=2719234 RepID=UPI0029E2553F|nr:zinc transport system substrate-binding protein [Lacrimispora sp.]
MNKTNLMKAVLFTAAVSAALLSGCGQKEDIQDSGKLTVMASFYPMYDFAVKIGGDKVAVANMIPAGTEPHDWEPATKDIANLEKADVFVYSGAGMEHWAEDVLKTLKNQNLTVAEASSGITLMKGHEHEEGENQEAESEEHEHGEFDPHVWLSPANAKIEMENIKDAFVKADPENEAYYQANYESYAGKFDELDKKYKDTLSPLPNKSVVVAHEAFGYLCDAYGLTQMGIEGLSPDSEPDPARMAEVIDFVKENKVKTIFFEDLVSPKVAETIAKETGAKTEVLNPLEGLTDEQLKNGDDYFSVMEKNLTVLKEALE